MNRAEISKILANISIEDLKRELEHRKVLERAKRHLPSAEKALKRAKDRVEAYTRAIKDDEARKSAK